MNGSPIVDVHLHLYRTPDEGEAGKRGYEIWEYGERGTPVAFSRASGDPDSALAAMREAGASRAVVVNLLDIPRPGVPPADDLMDFNRWLCDLAASHDEFVPFLAVDPRILDVPATVDHLRDMAENHGARGIKLHPVLQQLDLGDPGLAPLFEACSHLDLTVLTHSGPSRDGPQYAEPDAIRSLLSSRPDLRVIVAHMGGAAWRQLPALARDFPSAYFDLCEIIEWLGAANAPDPAAFVNLIRQVGVERVLLGSDFPWYDIDHSAGLVMELPGLSSSEKEAILGLNAIRFLRLD
ncbi:MAG TPA: amidohydrolase family protein [Candidatus Limnocylindrales bacterium]|nr:amidohydrolase family protein [Candidatus Limnocylindrales bacterium]